VGGGSKLSLEVRDELARRVVSGELSPGSQLPAEPQLAGEFGVSRATLREALRSLEDEGVLSRTPGAGTFVTARPRLSNNLDVNFGVTEAILAAGMEPGTSEAEVQEGAATADEARRLALEPGSPVIAVERVRTADGRPVVFSRDVLSTALAEEHARAGRPRGSRGAGRNGGRPSLAGLRRALARRSVYEVLETELGLVIHHGVATLRPMAAPARVAERLGVRRGTLVLYVRQVDHDLDGRPLLYSHEHHLADAFEFTVVRRGPGRRRQR
jgi:GntR family transcriptional regulator